eukprot:m.39518 g.39518  ORF g.39518 m.39518 type:complete len:298 (-) comp12679_c0_seq7:258-1151(-)
MATDKFNDGATSPGFCSGASWRLACKLIWSYKWEWLMCIAMQAIGGLPQVFITPYESAWSLQEPSLQLAITPGRDEAIVTSIVLLTVYGVAGIIIFSLIPVLTMPWRGYLNIREIHHLALTYFYAVCLETFVRGLLNLVRGGLRPDFYDLCQPNVTAWQPGVQPICTSGEDLDNGRRSFPCGHCSFSCAGGILFTLHLLALFNYFNGHGRIWQFSFALLPTLGAWLVSVSRITDGRHHGSDVVFGVLIGTVSGQACSWRTIQGYCCHCCLQASSHITAFSRQSLQQVVASRCAYAIR